MSMDEIHWLQDYFPSKPDHHKEEGKDDENQGLQRWICNESKKLWRVVGPAIVSRLVSYSTQEITQAFAGHLGDLELDAIRIANNVIVSFNRDLLLRLAIALEKLFRAAFEAKKYNMFGVHLQRSWIVLLGCCVVSLPMYPLVCPILKLLGHTPELAELAGAVALYFIPVHFGFALLFPLLRLLQSQNSNGVIIYVSGLALAVHVNVSWLFVYKLKLGVAGTALTLSVSWWVLALGLFCFAVRGGWPLAWTGFSMEAFSGLWDSAKLSASSGVMAWMVKTFM